MASLIKNTQRSKLVTFIVWRNRGEEREHDYETVCRVLRDLHIKAALSPLHDSDTYSESDVEEWRERHKDKDGKVMTEDGRGVPLVPPEVGQPKPPHWHVICTFGGPKSLDQLRRMFEPLHVRAFYTVESKDGLLRYFCHLDDPDKAQYDRQDVTAFGGMDLSALYDVAASDERQAMFDLIDLCSGLESELNPGAFIVTRFCDLVRIARQHEDRPELFKAVLDRSSFWGLFLSSLRQPREWERARTGETEG